MTMITLKLPETLYAKLQALATEEQIDPVEMIDRLVAMARERSVSSPLPTRPPARAFQRILNRATDLGVTDLAECPGHYLYLIDKGE